MNLRKLISTTLISLLFVAITCSSQLAAQQDHTVAVRFATLVSFNNANGSNPTGPLIQGQDQNLYGTTSTGGSNGAGTFFKMSPRGDLTTLYNFCSQVNCTDGGSPSGPLVLGIDGSFYGITEGGGANGFGTAFKVTSGGALTTIYNWCSQPNCADGTEPGTFVQASDGNFYGTNDVDGINFAGTAFRLTPNGVLTILYRFCSQTNCTDGSGPTGLIQARDGNFYGTADQGGANGAGTVFRMTPGGTLTTLYNFCSQTNCTDGELPSPLIQARDGNFYGTTLAGGPNTNPICDSDDGTCGTAFKINSQGVLTTLYNFCFLPDCADGALPQFSLLQAADGNFYGSTAPVSHSSNAGITVFRLTHKGELTTLHTFNQPFTRPLPLVETANGIFYGVTFAFGGQNDQGIVFELAVCGDEEADLCKDQAALKSPAPQFLPIDPEPLR